MSASHINLIGLTFLLLSMLSCTSSAPLRTESLATAGVGIATAKSTLDSVESELALEHEKYFAGFLIDEKGINHPTVEVIRPDGSGRRWHFEYSIPSLFLLDGQVHLVDYSGTVYRQEGQRWAEASFRLKPKSTVLQAGSNLIACTTPAVFKASREVPTCYSATYGWSLSYPVGAKMPRICGGHLALPKAAAGGFEYALVNLADGSEKRILRSNEVESVCQEKS